MKKNGSISIIAIPICIGVLFCSGCTEPSRSVEPRSINTSAPRAYQPVAIKILPLTEIGTKNNVRVLRAYVSLMDSFGDYVKSQATFRFELYQYVARSAEPKGARLVIWPDIDLTEAAESQQYWRDFLRGYEFELELGPVYPQSYLLQVTCICPGQVRLSAEYNL
ncbi:MAG: hypothetical protein PHF37_05195 [Phycisphaerae bacterium]|nr:hypothetical protein [Phycisphaerae bacterium]